MSSDLLERDKLIKQMRDIYNALSSEDALTLFGLAGEGITADLDAPKKLGMTEKRYYTRLKSLVEVGLVAKQEGVYKHTGLGSLVYDSLFKGLRQILVNRKGIDLLDELRRNARISQEDLAKITPVVLGDLENSLNLSNLKPVRIIKSYEDIVSTIQEYIERMKEEMYLATRYIDFRVVQSMLRNMKKGNTVYIINADRSNLTSKLQMLSNVMTHPGTVKLFIEMARKYRDKIQIRHAQIPYSFAIIDGEEVGIEIVNPVDPDNFFMGLQFKNRELAGRLIGFFNKIWASADQDPMIAALDQLPQNLAKELTKNNNRSESA